MLHSINGSEPEKKQIFKKMYLRLIFGLVKLFQWA